MATKNLPSHDDVCLPTSLPVHPTVILAAPAASLNTPSSHSCSTFSYISPSFIHPVPYPALGSTHIADLDGLRAHFLTVSFKSSRVLSLFALRSETRVHYLLVRVREIQVLSVIESLKTTFIPSFRDCSFPLLSARDTCELFFRSHCGSFLQLDGLQEIADDHLCTV